MMRRVARERRARRPRTATATAPPPPPSRRRRRAATVAPSPPPRRRRAAPRAPRARAVSTTDDEVQSLKTNVPHIGMRSDRRGALGRCIAKRVGPVATHPDAHMSSSGSLNTSRRRVGLVDELALEPLANPGAARDAPRTSRGPIPIFVYGGIRGSITKNMPLPHPY